MRRVIIGTVIALLGFTSAAWADGPIIRWADVVGVQRVLVDIQPDGTKVYKPGTVAGINPGGIWNATTSGRVMLNLESGFISIDVKGLSYSEHRWQSPIGETQSKRAVGTVVCESNDPAVQYVVDSEPFMIEQGDGAYRGFLDLAQLQSCRDRPEGIAFLLRNAGSVAPPWGNYTAYGIGRTIQTLTD